MEDAHLQSRGFVVEMEHPEVGQRTVAGLPATFSDPAALSYAPAPCLSEHTEAIFRGLLHLSADEMCRLQADKVIY
jgi:crotonobetainyl-CoA:carnitine CoA-transferase CaiB-like acyl-CoA transferase